MVPLQDTLSPNWNSTYTFNQSFSITPNNPPPYVCVTANNPNGVSPDDNPADDEQCASLLPDFQVFNIYPNPTKGILYINGMNLKLAKVYDSSGKLVSVKNTSSNSVNVENLPKGTYLIQSQDKDGKVRSDKFIKN